MKIPCSVHAARSGGISLAGLGQAQGKRYVAIDEDGAGPGGTDMLAILLLLQSPQVQPLGITVVTGDGWRDEEVAHALRLLELIGRSDIPVVPGAVFPLVRTKAWTQVWERLYGHIVYQGAWNPGPNQHGPFVIPPLREGIRRRNRSRRTPRTF